MAPEVQKRFGTTLLVGGLVSWFALMIYIVVANVNYGTKPSPLLMGVTVACWVVFFVGKTMMKSKEPKVDA